VPTQRPHFPSSSRQPATFDPSGSPREQKPIVNSPDNMVLCVRADSTCRDHEDKHAYNDHRLCRQRPHAVRDTTDSGCLPPLADPPSETPQNVSATKTFNGVFVRHSTALCTREQNSKNDDNDCGLSPKRLDELRPKTEGEVSRQSPALDGNVCATSWKFCSISARCCCKYGRG